MTTRAATRPEKRPRAGGLEVFCDGFCEPNPGGLASYGFVVEGADGRELHRGKGVAARGRGGPSAPQATNNLAEYTAAIRALRWLLDELLDEGHEGAPPVVLRSDSKLLVNQLAGSWRVKSASIVPLWQEARALSARFAGFRALWVPREENERADALSVEAYVEALESERAARADEVRLEPLGKGLFLANGRYRTDALFGLCDCEDFRRTNRGRAHVRCKHLLAASREWPHPPLVARAAGYPA